MTTDLPPSLVAYLGKHADARAGAVASFLGLLTARERALFQDAAVMGYARGGMHPQGEEYPKGGAVLGEVIDACFAFPNLYPAVNAHFEDHSSSVEYFIQCQQPDGTWTNIGSPMDDLTWAAERLTELRERTPDSSLRVARRTTTEVVEIARERTSEGDA